MPYTPLSPLRKFTESSIVVDRCHKCPASEPPHPLGIVHAPPAEPAVDQFQKPRPTGVLQHGPEQQVQ